MNRYGLALVTVNALALVACVMIVAGQLLSGEQLRTAIPDTTATSTRGDWVT